MDVNYDPPSKRIKIQFHYASKPETADERRVDDGLLVLTGQRSEKVLGFDVDPHRYKPEDISVRIVEGVEEQIRRATRDIQRLNYRFIQNVVRTLEPVILTATEGR